MSAQAMTENEFIKSLPPILLIWCIAHLFLWSLIP